MLNGPEDFFYGNGFKFVPIYEHLGIMLSVCNLVSSISDLLLGDVKLDSDLLLTRFREAWQQHIKIDHSSTMY